jgi:hypothetical protein
MTYQFNYEKIFKIYFFAFIAVGFHAFLQLFLFLFGIEDPFFPSERGLALIRPRAFSYEPSYYALYQSAFVLKKFSPFSV